MENHLTNEEIDLLALKVVQQKLISDERYIHLNNCDLCRKKFEDAKNYFQYLSSNQSELDKDKLTEIVNNLSLSEAISLKPFNPILEEKSFLKNNITLLAADTAEQYENNYIKDITFASKEKGILLKILEDNSKKNTAFYLLAKDEISIPNSLLIICNEDGTIEDYLIDEHGRCLINQIFNFDWYKTNILLLKCKGLLNVNDSENKNEVNYKFHQNNNYFTYKPSEGLLEFSFDNELNITRIYIFFSDGTKKLYFIPRNKFFIKLTQENAISRILLY